MTLEISGGKVAAGAGWARRPGLAIWLYLGVVSAAEVVTALVNPIAGILFHSVLLALLVTHAAVEDDPDIRRLLLPLTLAPLTRILSLAMPLTLLPQIWWYPVIYLPLAVGTLVVMRQTGLTWRDVGFNVRNPLWQVLIVPIGAVLGLAEYLILRPAPLQDQLTAGSVAFASLVFIATTGLVEEWVFRGVLQKVMKDRFGWRGLVYSSLLFTVLHLGFLSVLDIVFVFAAAMLFAWLVNRTGSFLGVALAHGLINVVLYMIGPLLLA